MMKHLTQEERYKISTLLELGIEKKEIAIRLGRNRTTIYRELKRNSDQRNGNYEANLAQRKSDKRHKEKNKHIVFTEEMKGYVTNKIRTDLSPEQIKGEAVKLNLPCISHERIYQFVWLDKKQDGKLYLHLRNQGRKYQKRADKQAGRGCISNRIDIDQRPDIVDQKKRIGDLEIDLIIGKDHKGALLTINDRATGMLKMGYIESKSAYQVEVKTEELLDVWRPFLKTITSDNGKEFANHENISEELNIDFFFAKPYQSWQRGANENLNGLVRQYFRKGTSFANITKEAVKEVEKKLNNRPRKRYGFKTPNEVQAEYINKLGHVAFMS
jgi:IS30 family transposase